MSLFRKLVILFGLLVIVILSVTLTLVYFESQHTIVELSKQRAVSIIQTIDSALESNIPDYQFEDVLLHLKSKDPDIISFDIYKLNGFLYDIASTNPNRIGTQSNDQNVIAVGKNMTLTSLHGNVMEITAPIHGYKGVIYSANVQFSIADDLRSTQHLLTGVLMIGICAIVLAVFAAWLFTREFLSKPVLAIVSAVDDVASGNLQVDLSESERRRDEIGHLARSFHRMTTSLQRLLGRMAETADTLNQEFESLVASGDYTAQGALQVSDVIHHTAHAVETQAVQLSELRTQMGETLNRLADTVACRGESAGESDEALEAELLPDNWDKYLLDELREWVTAADNAVAQAKEVETHLRAVSSTANGQLGALQEVNRTAAQLSQIANELLKLISVIEI